MVCCKKCGARMEGDGVNTVLHCEFVENTDGIEPDSNPVYCDFEVDENGE